jgi:hypothetical protein
MHKHLLPHTSPRGSLRRLASASALVPLLLLLMAPSVAAADLKIQARALLDGHIRIGSWAAVTVTIRNDGPAVRGELRLSDNRAGVSIYAAEVELPTTSEKAFVLYGQPSLFVNELKVSLVSAGQSVASTTVKVTRHDATKSIIALVAERPERLLGDINAAAASGPTRPDVISMAARDLPPRVEPWFGIDQLVWQDVDTAALSTDQLKALETWIAAGGRLVVVGGTTGSTVFGGLSAGLLPYHPTTTANATAADIRSLLGSAVAPAGTYPALAGTLGRGTVLASSGGQVIAAQASYGRGGTTLIGVDPGQSGFAGSAAARALWGRALAMPGSDPRSFRSPDETSILSARNRLPSVELPRVDQLFGLLAGYIVLVGPLNYLVLRRLDRREWAWLTIPALVVVFAVGTYAFGRVLKGDDVIVNQLSVVRTASGTEQGLAQTYVGVFSPTRQKFDISVGRAPLLSSIAFDPQMGLAQPQPLDVISGEKARIRGYQVGYGVLRGFRAEATVPGPLVEAELRFADGRLTGQIRNRSNAPLEAGAIVFGSSVQVVGTIDVGGVRTVDMPVGGAVNFGMPLSDRLFPGDAFGDFGTDADRAEARIRATRRVLVDQLSVSTKFGGGMLARGVGGEAPVLLAWRGEGVLPVELAGQHVQNMGQTLYAVSLPVALSGRTVLGDDLIRYTVLDSEGAETTDQGGGFSLGRGSLTVEYRPPSFQGRFDVTKLSLGITQGEPLGGVIGGPLRPLPLPAQPPQDDPTETGNLGGPIFQVATPAVQLFDRVANKWVEFPRIEQGRSYDVQSPDRYVDASGAFVVRFVGRGDTFFFRLLPRLEGTIQ